MAGSLVFTPKNVSDWFPLKFLGIPGACTRFTWMAGDPLCLGPGDNF